MIRDFGRQLVGVLKILKKQRRDARGSGSRGVALAGLEGRALHRFGQSPAGRGQSPENKQRNPGILCRNDSRVVIDRKREKL